MPNADDGGGGKDNGDSVYKQNQWQNIRGCDVDADVYVDWLDLMHSDISVKWKEFNETHKKVSSLSVWAILGFDPIPCHRNSIF